MTAALNKMLPRQLVSPVQHLAQIPPSRQAAELTREELCRKDLWYGFGHKFYCNIADEGGHALPSFGPLRIGEQVKEKT